MKASFFGIAGLIMAMAAVGSAEAKGCLRGAAVGGLAGHVAGHHGVVGAAVGCIIGRHEANKRDRLQSDQTSQPRRDLRDDGRRI